jgi:hypothetical protein
MNNESSTHLQRGVLEKPERSLDGRGVAVIVAATAFLFLWCGLCMGFLGNASGESSRQSRRAQQCSGTDMSFPESFLSSLH